jgi:shikimate kinase
VSDNRDKIVLVGFMGTGKSTVARLLSEKLGFPRIDVDDEIERREGRTIADIFASEGEHAFRRTESIVLESVLKQPGSVIVAAGGGAVLAEANRVLMLQYGWVAALTADAEQIIARVRHDTTRPLLEGDVEVKVRTLLEERKHAYDFADLRLDTTKLSPPETASRIAQAWKAAVH